MPMMDTPVVTMLEPQQKTDKLPVLLLMKMEVSSIHLVTTMTVHTVVEKLKQISSENMELHKAMLLQIWLEHTECHLKLEMQVVVV